MALDKPINSITEDDLLALITDQYGEQQSIDYKKGLFLDRDEPKTEFRADVTSFANSTGGHLIIGMEEAGGIPINLCGFDIPDAEKFKLRIEETLNTKVNPRVPGIEIQTVPLRNGKQAAVIRVPQSFAKPHQITKEGNDFQFWARHSTGKYRLDVEELRSIILQSQSISDRIRQFRMDRISGIRGGDAPLPVNNGGKIVLHFLPLNAFGPQMVYDLSSVRERCGRATLPRLENYTNSQSTFNLDGYLVYHSFEKPYSSNSYFQLYRNGIIEIMDEFYFAVTNEREGGPRWHDHTESLIYRLVKKCLEILKLLGTGAPVVVLLSLINVAECKINSNKIPVPFPIGPMGRDVIMLPDVLFSDPDVDIDPNMQFLFNIVWNCFGLENSLNFDNNGRFTLLG
jgi:hypothetical protein